MANRTDNFNRADSGTLGTPSDAGSDWALANGTFAISSNKASGGGAANEVAYLESSVADVDAQVTLPSMVVDGDNGGGVVARLADNDNYLLMQASVGNGWDLYKKVSGSFTLVVSASGTPADGDVLKLTCNGNSVSMYVNGVQKGATQTVTEGASNTKHGIRSHNGNIKFDDFSITAIGGGAQDTPELQNNQRQIRQLLAF
jgi:hypothetical protein